MTAATLAPEIAFAGEKLSIDIKFADARIDPQTKQTIIFVKLTDESKLIVAEITKKNIGKTIELRVNGQAVMKPVIREALLGGVFEISSDRKLNEAKEIAKTMSSGAKIEIEIAE